MTTVEIYFDDLSEEKQKELLKAVEAENPEDMNWDTFPVACVDLGDDEG
jgi:hypothetical protein